jgi:tetratricopeptide (TPR) repeat protein
MGDPWVLERDVLRRALDLPRPERRGFLTAAAGDDCARAARFHRLLALAEGEDALLAPLHTSSDATLDDVDPNTALGRAGQSFGSWRLVRLLGRGGMGEVWLAERHGTDFAQRVAIKLPRRALDAEGAIVRFLRERALLAGLQHPGIARLLDGGLTDDGLPWFAMEYVDGVAIDRYAEAAALSIHARVRLVRDVADTLAAAHARGVIHRDLKPSNVLVGADARAVLVDFGIATAPGERAGAGTAAFATPGYAAPEQLRGEPATTAVDVYSLARLLDRLVPTRDADLAAIQRAGSAESPTDRIPTAAAFREELDRWLQRLPIRSRATGWVHRQRLWLRRNPLAAALAYFAAALAIAAVVAITASWRAETRARQAAEDAGSRRAAAVRELRSLVGELVFGVHDRIGALPGAVPVRKFLLETADRHLRVVERDANTDDSIGGDVFEIAIRLADVAGATTLGSFGDLASAMGFAVRARDLAQHWCARRPDAFDWHERCARAERMLGDLARLAGDPPRARDHYARAHQAAARGSAIAADSPALERLRGVVMLQEGRIALSLGEFEFARERLSAARSRLAALASKSTDGRLRRDLAIATASLAHVHRGQSDFAAAKPLFMASIEELAFDPKTDVFDVQRARDHAEWLAELARCHAVTGEPAIANAKFDEAMATAEALAARDPTNHSTRRTQISIALIGARMAAQLGQSRQQAERYAAAEGWLRAALAEGVGGAGFAIDLAECLVIQAESDLAAGQAQSAVARSTEANEQLAKAMPAGVSDIAAIEVSTLARVIAGNARTALGEPELAVAEHEAGLRALDGLAAENAELPWVPRTAARLHLGEGSAHEALAESATDDPARRRGHLDAALESYRAALGIAERLRAEGRLAGHERAIPELFRADVERVVAALSRG